MTTIPKQEGVQPRLWTKEEYYRLGELGFFHCQKVELLDGELMVHSPQNALHADTTDNVRRLLDLLFGAGYLVRCQFPVNLGLHTEPEPDVAVVPGVPRQFQTAHPTSAELIVEVSDSTLRYDRHRKGSLYARAGIADYWVINLVDNQIEVYRNPVPDPTQHYGYRYSSQTIVVPPGTVTPLALPQAAIPAADLLP